MAREGRVDEAVAEREKYLMELGKLPSDATMGLNSAGAVLAVGTSLLDAQIAKLKGDSKGELELLKKAVDAQDALSYDEPPDWFYSVRETLGAALIQAGNPAEAEKVFRKDLELNPGNGRSLYGLSMALSKQGKKSESARVMRKFRLAWKRADSKLRLRDM